ncbi:ArnT family glycosyltransferase [Thermodesulfobacteriota bacterium]
MPGNLNNFPNSSLQGSKTPYVAVLEHWLQIVLVILLTLLMIAVIILAWVPPVSKDALTHHLAVPKLYLQHGGVYEIPDIVFSYYPMNLDLLYVVPLYFKNDIIPKYIHFLFALLTAGLIFAYLKKRISTVYGLFGVLLFLSLPIIVKLSITVYVDLGLIFFSTAALIVLFKWLAHRFQSKYLLLSAACCGMALGTKYTGLIVFFLLSLFVPFLYLRSTVKPKNIIEQTKASGYAILFVSVSLLVFSPWMARNYIWTQNPIYPLYDNVFNPRKADSLSISGAVPKDKPERSGGPLNHFSLRRILYQESGWQIGLVPVRIFFEGKDGEPQYFDGKLNPLLFFLPFFAFVRLKKNSESVKLEKKVLLAFSVLVILVVFFKDIMRIRWIAPAVPPLVMLSAFGLYELATFVAEHSSTGNRRIWRGALSVVIVLTLSLNAIYIWEQFKTVDPVSYISGKVGRDDYIERFRRDYAAMRFANQNLSEDTKILALFLGKRRYYSNRHMVFDTTMFRHALHQSKSPEMLTLRLNEAGITHLLVRYDLFATWVDTNFGERKKAMLQKFFKEHATLMFSRYMYGLFQV